jgi:hypothetical protein
MVQPTIIINSQGAGQTDTEWHFVPYSIRAYLTGKAPKPTTCPPGDECCVWVKFYYYDDEFVFHYLQKTENILCGKQHMSKMVDHKFSFLLLLLCPVPIICSTKTTPGNDGWPISMFI